MPDANLQFYHHPSQDNLADLLAHHLTNERTSIFHRSTVIVQTRGMATWLRQYIASKQQVCMQVDFPLPNNFFRSILDGLQLHEDTFISTESLTWQLFSLLPDIIDDIRFKKIRRYLKDSKNIDQQKLYQLAVKIAELFDSYLIYRADMIHGWEQANHQAQSADESWQRELWLLLNKRYPENRHWYKTLQTLSELKPTDIDTSKLPSSLHLFGITNFPPIYIDCLHYLARFIPVHLYWQNPVFTNEGYWEDAPNKKTWLLSKNDNSVEPLANPLLACFGKLGREFIHNLYTTGSGNHYEWHNYQVETEPAVQQSLLGQLQNDIYFNKYTQLSISDDSVSIHSSHTTLREIENLRQFILKQIDLNKDLDLNDIIVICPSIEAYSPAIDSIFGSAPYDSKTYIPYRICDRSKPAADPMIDFCLNLFELHRSRFTTQDVLKLLAFEGFIERIKLSTDLLADIKHLIDTAGIRWGLDDAHVETYTQQSQSLEHTWERGLERMMLGYSLSQNESNKQWNKTIPLLDIEGLQTHIAGALAEAIEKLSKIKNQLLTKRSLTEWADFTVQTLTNLVSSHTLELKGYQLILNALDTIRNTSAVVNFTEPLESSIFLEHLSSHLNKSYPSGSFLSGNLTFCELKPMRSIPAKLVCMVGLNYEDFPRKSHNVAFDLIHQQPRYGDRSSRDDDTYAFLEAILSAKKTLYLSYLGRSQKDNTKRPAATPLQTLIEYYPILKEGIVEHPLHNHHPDYFKKNKSRSYDQKLLEVAIHEQTNTSNYIKKPLFEKTQTKQEPITLTIDAFIQSFTKTSQTFLKESLKASLSWLEKPIRSSELIEFTGLERHLALQKIHQLNTSDIREVLTQADLLPPHVIGEHHLSLILDAVQSIKEQLSPTEQTEVHFSDEDITIYGYMDTVENNPCSIESFQYSIIPKKVEELALAIKRSLLAIQNNAPASSTLYLYDLNKNQLGKAKNKVTTPDEAKHLLKTLCQILQQNKGTPIPHFPDSSAEYHKIQTDPKKETYSKELRNNIALDGAYHSAWQDGFQKKGEQSQFANQLLYDVNAPFDHLFTETSMKIWELI